MTNLETIEYKKHTININLDDDPKDGIEYRGWWRRKTTKTI